LGAEAEAAPAVSLVIPHLLTQLGVWYPRGGIGALAETVGRWAEKAGAALRLDEAAEGVEILGGRVTAVRTAGGRLAADACVSAVDLATTARWIGGGPLERLARRLRPARTARVAWWLVEGRRPRRSSRVPLRGRPGREPSHGGAWPDRSTLARASTIRLRHTPARPRRLTRGRCRRGRRPSGRTGVSWPRGFHRRASLRLRGRASLPRPATSQRSGPDNLIPAGRRSSRPGVANDALRPAGWDLAGGAGSSR
jgi:hypothetical protein